jgi:hypothetical protein
MGNKAHGAYIKSIRFFLKNGKIYHDSKKLHFYTVTVTFIGDQALATNCVRLSVLHVIYFQRKKNGSLIILTFYQFVNRNPRIACTCIWACPSSTQRHHCRSHHQAKEVVRTTLHVMFHYRNCEKLGQQRSL